ncbi:hypothetical protein B0H12DRAFT_1081932 [Mycena haematopus]|nr:hypothetical protein B0H12DRAFT_1081932 [Mycena haematopus]
MEWIATRLSRITRFPYLFGPRRIFLALSSFPAVNHNYGAMGKRSKPTEEATTSAEDMVLDPPLADSDDNAAKVGKNLSLLRQRHYSNMIPGQGRKTRARKAQQTPDADEAESESTGPPKKKSKGQDTENSDLDDAVPSDQDSELPAVISPSRKKKNKKPAESKPEKLPESIILLVPTIHGASQRVSIPYNNTFDQAAAAIFDAIPCTEFSLKPTLSFKLNSKSAKILLTDVDSWSSLRKAVVARLNDKKKASASNDAIDICLSPDNYLASVQARKNPKLAKKKRGAKDVIDLDHKSDADEDDVGGETSVMEKEAERLGELERKHQGKCHKCASDQPEAWCKIDKSGNHTPITYVMRNSWAHSLALEEHGVTLDNPPNSPLFAAFHKKRDDLPPNKASTTTASGQTPTAMMDLMMMGMMEQAKMNTAFLATLASGSSIRRYPSAGSPSRRPQPIATDTAIPEGELEDIADFFDFLDTVDMRRQVDRYLQALIADEVLNVGDIVRQGEKYLESPAIGMKPTLASWVVQLAKKRLNRTGGDAR